MIVYPGAPPVTAPEEVTSPEGWLTAVIDPAWAGVYLAVDYTAGDTPLDDVADVLKVRITRADPGTDAPVPVRSADLAWAVEGVGAAYDHEAPLGVAVVYTATPQYADGAWGETTALGLTVPAPSAGQHRDLWIKSLDLPGLSLRAMIVDPQGTSSAGRQETASRSGSPYTAVAYDTAAAPARQVTLDIPPEQVPQMRELLRSGVLLAQVRPGYLWPDQYFVPNDVGEKPSGRLGSSNGFQFTFDVVPVERPATEGQPMRAPGWSYGILAAQVVTYDAVAAGYGSYLELATNGAS